MREGRITITRKGVQFLRKDLMIDVEARDELIADLSHLSLPFCSPVR